MELFPAMTGFYEAIAEDARIGTSHISLYMALLQQWNLSGGKSPVIVVRETIMKASKINSRCTYNKCLNNLQEFGYIKYLPSSNSFNNSTVYLRGLCK